MRTMRAFPCPSLPFLAFLAFLGVVFASAQVPRVPFAGMQGATAGAGSLLGWERHGGDNPAVLGPPGWGASLAGYSPFGLDALRVLELEAKRDAANMGVSLGWRGLFEEAGSAASRLRVQAAWKPGTRWSGGGSVSWHAPSVTSGAGNSSGSSPRGFVGVGTGMLWHPYRFVSLGAAWDADFAATGTVQRAGIGADIGTRFGSAYAWRLAVEHFAEWGGGEADGAPETRYGFGFQFHRLLSVYAGLSPRHETAALGARFGMGSWEGFSALRRHAVLGGTSIQGLQWRRPSEEQDKAEIVKRF